MEGKRVSGPTGNRPHGESPSPTGGRGAGGRARPRRPGLTRPGSGSRPATRIRPGEIAPTQMVPIAVKYAGISAILLILFLVFVARSDLRIAVATADERINRNGIQLALMFSEAVDPFWADGTPETKHSQAQSALQLLLETRIQDPALEEDVLDVLVFGSDRNLFVARARGSVRRLSFEREQTLETAAGSRAGVEIRTGFLADQRARFFERPIFHEGNPVGAVQVFLSAAVIDHLGDELQASVLLNGLIALGVGIPVVLLVGTLLTRPIRELKRDMETVAAGDLEHQSAVRSHDELGKLAAAFNRMTHQLAEAQEQELRRQALERELSIATRIQSALLPETLPEVPGYQLSAHYLSAKEVGGDYYDFIPLDGERFGIVVADVSGKGIPGSLVMTMTRSLVRMAASIHPRVSDLLAQVNASLSRDMTRGMFVTMVYLAWDPGSGKIQIGRAGHDPVFLYQASEGAIGQLQPGGIALGMDRGPIFNQNLQVGEVALEPGDFLVLYTDGVTEAMDPEAREYTPERFVAVLEAAKDGSADAIIEAVIQDLAEHTAGAEQSDDVTLLVLKREVAAGSP